MEQTLNRDVSEIIGELECGSPERVDALLHDLEDALVAAMAEFDLHHRERVEQLTSILMRAGERGDLERRARVLGDACFYFSRIGRSFDGIPVGVAAQALAARHGFVNLERLAGNALATAYISGACFEEACQTLERTLVLARQLGDPALECLAISNTGGLLKEMGLYRDAIGVIDRALSFDLASPRGRYLALGNAIHGLFSAHRLRDDAAALRYLRIGSDVLEDNPLSDIVQKTTFEYLRAMYLLFRQDNETAEMLIAAARERAGSIANPRVEILLAIAGALCDWASRELPREMLARKRLIELYHRSKQTRLYHDDVLRALMEVHGRTMTGQIDLLDRSDPFGAGVDGLKRLIDETARTAMRYAKELVDYTAGAHPSKELVEFTTGVKRAKFYRQVSDREAAARARQNDVEGPRFDPFAQVRGWLTDGPAPETDRSALPGAPPALQGPVLTDRSILKHDELTAIHGELARFRTASLRATMRTAAYDVAENWAVAAEFFDDQTGQHCFRVGRLAGLLAAEIGLDAEFVARLEHAARLHDIGKIAVNEMILLKPGPLDAGEVIAMRAHTEVGAQLLEGSADATLQMAAKIAKYHHAWWNGGGYPKVAGELIPLEARICAFSDVYDALTHERPYKRAWSHRHSVEQMMGENGTHFDPSLMRPFLRVLERHVGSNAEPPSTQLHLIDMEASGILTSRRKLMAALQNQ